MRLNFRFELQLKNNGQLVLPDVAAKRDRAVYFKFGDGNSAPAFRARKRWLGIRFDCCDVYNRVYKNAAGTAYVGRCPKCCRRITVRVGLQGTTARFFRAL